MRSDRAAVLRTRVTVVARVGAARTKLRVGWVCAEVGLEVADV